MISASTAYDRTIRNIENNTTEEMENISKEISDAVKNGRFRITINKLSGIASVQLKNLGYKIDIKSQYNESYYVISWEK